MSGIVGYWTTKALLASDHIIKAMTRAMGPAKQAHTFGEWTALKGHLGIGHSQWTQAEFPTHGSLPMRSHSGRWVIAYEGEIYNTFELRKYLVAKGHPFRGNSDTEVLLASIQEWGVDGATRRLNGVFAFSLWDNDHKHLHLARDRTGIKPIYYGMCGQTFLFASELKALWAHPHFESPLDEEAIALFLGLGYIPAPYSPFSKIRKLLPGAILTLTQAGSELPVPRSYWSSDELHGQKRPTLPNTEIFEAFHKLIENSVIKQMRTSFEVGTFLSGCIDSSLVAALMQKNSSKAIPTFSLAPSKGALARPSQASLISSYLKTDHLELHLSETQIAALIPDLSAVFSEPFADFGGLEALLLSQLARTKVQICLSGYAGDELFGTYKPTSLGTLFHFLKPTPTLLSRLEESPSLNLALERIKKATTHLSTSPPLEWYQQAGGKWEEEQPSPLPIEHLINDKLAKMNQAGQYNGLQLRMPLLDHRLIELFFRIPYSFKVRHEKHKWILRHILHHYIPRKLADHPKTSFHVPLGKLLRGPLQAWGDELLSEKKLKESGVFDPLLVMKKWKTHTAKHWNWEKPLWPILMFQSWFADYRKARHSLKNH